MFISRTLRKKKSHKDEKGATELPLTEKNIEFLNQQEQDAGNEVQRPRKVQISEWLRLIP